MDHPGGIGLLLVAVGGMLIWMSAFVLLEPLWLAQLAVGVLFVLVGAALYAVHAIQVLTAALDDPVDRSNRPASR